MSGNPPNMVASETGINNLQLTDVEIAALIKILHFAKNTADILAQQEVKTPVGLTNVNNMNQLSADSRELMRIIVDSVSVGEPVSDERH